MKLVVISSAAFVKKENGYLAYSPYIKEMAIWARHSDEIAFTCPVWQEDHGQLVSHIDFRVSRLFALHDFNIKNVAEVIKALLYSFGNFFEILRSMAWADHIHLRCPGNVGLMGCLAQIFFPSKPKTAKYAGNWDPDASQPLSYKLQRWILSNTFLTRNMQVLVYGEWEGQSKNIKPFFTASYKESDKLPVGPKHIDAKLRMVFAGTLSAGKRPLYAIRLVEALHKRGIDIHLALYGHGEEKQMLDQYIKQQQLEKIVSLEGNQSQDVVMEAFQKSHFVVLPSQSEGWPKVLAEGMFWGCLPVASKVSCVANMLGYGKRGVLLTMEFEDDVEQLLSLLNQREAYADKVEKSINWSRKYTLDLFEAEIKLLLKP